MLESSNQKAWLKSCIDLKTQLRKKAKNDSGKDFFKIMNDAVFGKTMENVNLESERNYHITKFFTGNLLSVEMRKTQAFMNKTVYLCLLILQLSKIIVYEFWYDYVKTNDREREKLCFVVCIKIEDIYKYIAKYDGTRFVTSKYELNISFT